MEDEKKIKNMPDPVTISGTETLLNQMKNCICKIKINQTNGTGFFCTIPYGNETMNVLMTNNHIINKNDYNENNKLNLFINDDKDAKILILKIERKTYFNEKYDLAMIELKEDDNINHFLELDDNLFKNEINAFYEDISIYVIQYPLGNNAAVSYGFSNGINDFEINHTCSTEHGSSGSPILNLSNNKIIGIHKQSAKNFNYNIGTCLQFPLNDFFEKNEIDNNNFIKEVNKENKKNNKSYYDGSDKYNDIEVRNELNKIIRRVSDTIPDLKYSIGTGPKINVVFDTDFGLRNNLILNFGTSIDQMLKIYLRRYDIEYLYNKNDKIIFLFKANKIKFGDKTPIENFFKYDSNPKVTVFPIPNSPYLKFSEKEYKFHSLISEIMNYLNPPKYYNNKRVNNVPNEIEITIKFNKKGKIIKIKMSNYSMVAELIYEYFEKTKTKTGTFNFYGIILEPFDTSLLYCVGLKDNSEIIVE